MKGKIETAANVTVIILAVVIGSFFLKDQLLFTWASAATRDNRIARISV
jgi:hypothetical protein